MTISICDLCLKQPTGYPLTTFEVNGRAFQVCVSCEWRPFAVPPAHHFTVTVVRAERSGVDVVAAGGAK